MKLKGYFQCAAEGLGTQFSLTVTVFLKLNPVAQHQKI